MNDWVINMVLKVLIKFYLSDNKVFNLYESGSVSNIEVHRLINGVYKITDHFVYDKQILHCIHTKQNLK